MFGVAWSGRGGIKKEAWGNVVDGLSKNSSGRKVVALGKWSSGTLARAEAEGMQAVIRFTKLKAKDLKAVSKAFGKQEGFGGSVKGAHRRLKFTPATSGVEVELLALDGSRIGGFSRTSTSSIPGFAAFEPGEYKKVIKKDPKEALRKNIEVCVWTAVHR